MIRRLTVLAGSTFAALGAACTAVSTDPNAVVAVRFDGSDYPSIVVGDSLRDSLGALQPVRATALNYKGNPIEGANFVFTSPDTVLRVFAGGNVFATRRKPDGSPARVFASVGSLQSRPDSLVVVQRADSMAAQRVVDTIPVTAVGGATPDTLRYTLFGDTLLGAPKAPVPSWLVSFQIRHRTTLLAPTDTSIAYSYVFIEAGLNTRRVATFVDTTDASGRAERRVWVQPGAFTASEDTIFLVATARPRKVGSRPISKETMIVVRRQ